MHVNPDTCFSWMLLARSAVDVPLLIIIFHIYTQTVTINNRQQTETLIDGFGCAIKVYVTGNISININSCIKFINGLKRPYITKM